MEVREPNKKNPGEVHESAVWFRARKSKPLYAKLVNETIQITSLEGKESVSPGDFTCRGDVWPQSAESLNNKYEASGSKGEDGWQVLLPRQDTDGILAATINHEASVSASWGDLRGKPVDYLL